MAVESCIFFVGFERPELYINFTIILTENILNFIHVNIFFIHVRIEKEKL